MDPYAVSQAALRKAMYTQHGHEFKGTLLTVTILYATSIILNFTSLVLRWKGGKLWLFRIHSTPGGEFITPNPVVNWLVSMLVFYASVTLYFTYRTWQNGKEGTDITNFIFWMMTVWLGIWSAGWLWAWSTALAPFLSPKGAPGRLDIRIPPSLVTGFFITIHIFAITVILALSSLANHKFNA